MIAVILNVCSLLLICRDYSQDRLFMRGGRLHSFFFFYRTGMRKWNKCLVSIASLLLPGIFREESYLTQEYMFGWVVFNSSYFPYNVGKHQSTYKCDGTTDTLVSVTGLNWISSLSSGKDIKVVTVKWVNLRSSSASELFCCCFLSSDHYL